MAPLYFIASYPRSGNTWVRSFIFALMRVAGYLPSTTPVSKIDMHLPWDALNQLARAVSDKSELSQIDKLALRPLVHQHIESFGHPLKVVKAHTLFGTVRGYPTFDPSRWRGACYLVRNPLDVAPSLARLLGVSVDEAITVLATPLYVSRGSASELWGSWSQNVDSWTINRPDNALILRYEDLSASLPSIARHAGFDVSDALLEKAVADTSLPEMQRLEASGRAFIPIRNGSQFFGGGAGQPYQDKLSPQQASRIIETHNATMLRLGYLDDEALAFARC